MSFQKGFEKTATLTERTKNSLGLIWKSLKKQMRRPPSRLDLLAVGAGALTGMRVRNRQQNKETKQ